LEEAYLFLGRKKTKGFADLAHHFETMEVEISPDPAHGVIDCLKELKGKYKLCIISDTIYTYGKGLREILEQFGVLDCFSGFIFSDEVGASKPSPKVFEAASKALKIDLRDMIHIGDRESNDVLGPLSVGMKAALYTGIKDRGGSESKANLVYRDHSQLPGLLEKL
jgi:HAD superfamily hydrolase (TIGR01549 family)